MVLPDYNKISSTKNYGFPVETRTEISLKIFSDFIKYKTLPELHESPAYTEWIPNENT